jgi:iron complex transport system substrate-binding protein
MERNIMKKIFSTCILAVLLLSMLVSCSKPAPTVIPIAVDTSITLTDGLGRTVTLEGPAERVVSMAPSVTEILYAVGAGDQVVGRDSFSDYPEEALDVTDIGGSMGDYSYETIASLNPDLVIAAEINTADQVKALEDLGLTVYYLANPTDFEGLYTAIETVGQLTGHASDAATLTDSLALRVQAVADTISQATTTPVVFYELDGSDPAKPWTSGPGTFMDMLISKAGGKNVGAALSSSWAQISVEELLVQNPEIILLGDAAYGMTPEQVAARTGWDDIAAVKDNKIFTFNDDLVSLAGPRLVDGLETIAKMIHPELFK